MEMFKLSCYSFISDFEIKTSSFSFSRSFIRETSYLTPVKQRFQTWMQVRVTASWWQLLSPPDLKQTNWEPWAHKSVHRPALTHPCKVLTLSALTLVSFSKQLLLVFMKPEVITRIKCGGFFLLEWKRDMVVCLVTSSGWSWSPSGVELQYRSL